MNAEISLVGDSIENPANALIMTHAAQMFGARCQFRDTKKLVASPEFATVPLDTISTAAELQQRHSRLIGCDNLPGARAIFGFAAGRNFAAMVGNERRGLSREFASAATDIVEIPMQSRHVNCLNVAAASATLLYYLCAPRVSAMPIRNDPRSRRPDVLFLAPRDHFEFGSALRSAAAFGWERAFIEDAHNAWFNCDRGTRSEARAAARRGKNDILLIPTSETTAFAYERVTIVTSRQQNSSIRRANLIGGPSQLIILPDETDPASIDATDWNRFGKNVEFHQLEIPFPDYVYHYRLPATIALAEITRQVGRRAKDKLPTIPRRPAFELALPTTPPAGELIPFADLVVY